jgi:Fibronectin type III domain
MATSAEIPPRSPTSQGHRAARSWLRYALWHALPGLLLAAVILAGRAPAEGAIAVPGPPSLSAVPAGSTQVNLSWDPPGPSHLALEGYDVFEGTSPGGESATPLNGAPLTATSYPATGLAPGTTYYFIVRAVYPSCSERGDCSAPSPEASATTLPAAPAGLAAEPAGPTQVSLTWDAPLAPGPGLEGYDVFDGTSSGLESATPVNGSPLPGTSYSVPGLIAQTTYYFTVTAVYQQCSDGCTTVESSPSAEAHATTASQLTAPGAPTGLVAVAAGRTQVNLNWNASPGLGLEGYDVFEGTRASGESATPLNDSPVIGTSRPVTGLKAGTTYYFTVSAVSPAGESARSNEAQVTLAGRTGPGGPHASKSGSVSRTHAPPGGLPLLAWALIILTGAAAALGAARHWLRARSSAGATAPQVRTEAHPGPLAIPVIRLTGAGVAHAVRIEPHASPASTTIKEVRS